VIARRRPRAPTPPHRRGFTLIELMIALTVSSLLVAMILQIFTKMSSGYRAQQNIAELQRRLTAAQAVIQRDVRQAGFQLLDGFQRVGSTQVLSPIQLTDNADAFGPDRLAVFYADPVAQARVMTIAGTGTDPVTSLTVDDPDNFGRDDLVVITNRELAPIGATIVNHTKACVLQVVSVAGTTVNFRVNGNWGDALNSHCREVRAAHALPAAGTMMYLFAARGYRIDPTRRELGVLQLSETGGLRNDWQDLGVGFTDLQVASRWYEGEDVSARRTTDTDDLDADAERDWYSGADQTTLTAPGLTWAAQRQRPLIMELRVTLVVRTRERFDGASSAQTPVLTVAARPDNNEVGNRAAVPLAGVADAARPTELRGDAIYRYATVGSDLRNLAVAR
jgi:prepilin-type N-terminal cleavage/methylation domain-containing protein